MKDVTRREFLYTATGVAASSAIIGHDAFLHGERTMTAGNDNGTGSKKDLPLQSWIFPQPQEISSSGSNFLVDNQVHIVVPTNASEEDRFLARSLEPVMNLS